MVLYVNLVFGIVAHAQPEMFAQLVSRLSPYPVIVHVDVKVEQSAFLDALDPESRDRVEWIEDRVIVNWSGYSQVEAMRRIVRRALDGFAAPDDYIVMLSGGCYPIRDVSELHGFLRSHPGIQLIRYLRVSDGGRYYTHQVERRHTRDLRFLRSWTNKPLARKLRNGVIRGHDFIINAGRRPLVPPHGFVFAHGSGHFALTASCLQQLENMANSEYVGVMKRVWAPDEKFYHTLIANSEYSSQVPDGGFAEYVGPGNYLYAATHFITQSHQVVATCDYDQISSSGKFFARKFSLPASQLLIDRIDRELLD